MYNHIYMQTHVHHMIFFKIMSSFLMHLLKCMYRYDRLGMI